MSQFRKPPGKSEGSNELTPRNFLLLKEAFKIKIFKLLIF